MPTTLKRDRQRTITLPADANATVVQMAEALGRPTAAVVVDLVEQGLRTLRTVAASSGDDEMATALERSVGPDLAVLALVDAANDRLDRLAEASVTAARRQATDVGVAFLRWAAEHASTLEDFEEIITGPVAELLDDLARREGSARAKAAAKSFSGFLQSAARDRYGVEA